MAAQRQPISPNSFTYQQKPDIDIDDILLSNVGKCPEAMQYLNLIPMLLTEVQKLRKEIASLKRRIQ